VSERIRKKALEDPTAEVVSTATEAGVWALVTGAVGKVASGVRGLWVERGAARGGRAVIGKLDYIAAGKLRPGENNLLEHLEGDLGSPQANWSRNSSVLRTEMNKGLPIRDASVNPMTGERLNNTGFLRAERNLLEDHGWTYDPSTTLWTPAVP
jgi:hypothetical protein